MKKAKIISSSFVRGRISKDIEIELSSKVIITANKWALWDDVEGDDSDWDWVDEDDSDWDWVDEESRKKIR